MKNIYTDTSYLDLNPTWHEEDSPWKATQILKMIRKHNLPIQSIAETGCGVGGILASLHASLPDTMEFCGFDISTEAIEKAKVRECDRLSYRNQDIRSTEEQYDLLLIIDVIEHVPDCYGFLEQCRTKARFKIYHIPLDIHVSSVVRSSMLKARKAVGHIHYFTAELALASLIDTGHTIKDYFFTDGSLALGQSRPGIKTGIANIGRRSLSLISIPWTARLLGGYSLLILAE